MILKSFYDLIFPILCQGCSREGSYLCESCLQKLSPIKERCFVCNKVSFLGRTHQACQSRQYPLTALLVASDYRQQSIQKLIWYLKYHAVTDIGDILAKVLSDFLLNRDLLQYFYAAGVIPVPLHQTRLRQRGFNQAELLAQGFCKNTGLAYHPLLQRIRVTEPQVDLEKSQRFQNVENAFTCSPSPSLGERKVILIDDVATTGATLNECAKVLKTQGVAEIWGLVVARN